MAELSIDIDRIRCDGHGFCAELFPEMIGLDDWGYPIIAPGPVPAHLVAHAERAVASCPVFALRVRRASAGPGVARQAGSRPRSPSDLQADSGVAVSSSGHAGETSQPTRFTP